MDTIENYKVTVKVEIDTGVVKKDGEPKIKKTKEVYLVTNCGSAKEAHDRVAEEFKNSMDEWFIDDVKAVKFDAILNAKS